jgi:hypothetical protein
MLQTSSWKLVHYGRDIVSGLRITHCMIAPGMLGLSWWTSDRGGEYVRFIVMGRCPPRRPGAKYARFIVVQGCPRGPRGRSMSGSSWWPAVPRRRRPAARRTGLRAGSWPAGGDRGGAKYVQFIGSRRVGGLAPNDRGRAGIAKYVPCIVNGGTRGARPSRGSPAGPARSS